MGIELSYTHKIIIIHCSVCGSPIALTSTQEHERREDQQTFHCPNGHGQMFGKSTEADRLKKELERERQRRELAESTSRMEATRAKRAVNKLKRIEKRVNNGVCPCCNRTFANLARHMKTKHPEELE